MERYIISWIGQINIVDMTIRPKANYKFNAMPIKLPMHFLNQTRTYNFKLVWEHKRPQKAKMILRKKEQSWKNHTPWLYTIPQSHSNRSTMVLAQKNPEKYRLTE